tara:strand:+ start:1665 stop:1856 length:192 start_codon:yes stop_codon:yes gene_type:complete
MYFIQCASCGHPVGVVEYYNTDAQITKAKNELESKIKSVAGELDSLYTNQQKIMRVLQQLLNK